MQLGKRLAVAAVGIPAVLAAIHFGGWILGALLAVVAGIGTREFYALARQGGTEPFDPLGVPAAAALVMTAALLPAFQRASPWMLGVLVLLLLAAASAAVWRRSPPAGPMGAVAVTVAGALYTGATLAHALFLRHLPEGWSGVAGAGADPWAGGALVVFPILVAWFGDTLAYFAGHAWGRRKLIPSVSPGKTVVGGVAGLAGSVAAAAAYGPLVLRPVSGLDAGILPVAAAGLVLGAVAQVGDLAESVVKREAGVKDSGAIFPGHGGVLDRADSILFTIPVGYWLVVLLRGLG